MAYRLKEVTIRTDNTDDGMRKIGELWNDGSKLKTALTLPLRKGLYFSLSHCEDDKPKDAEIMPFQAGSGYSLSAKKRR